LDDWKIRIAVLWIYGAVAMSAHYAMLFFESDEFLKALRERVIPRTELMEVFTNWLIPLTMAFLSVTLGDLANRRLNMVLGGLFAVLAIIHIAICPIVHISDHPSVHQLLISVSTVVATALVFWIAWLG